MSLRECGGLIVGDETGTSPSAPEFGVRLARRPVGWAWWMLLILAPLLLAALLTIFRGTAIEADLQESADSALKAAKVEGVTVRFDGRAATVTAPSKEVGAQAVTVVEGVDGVRSATATVTQATAVRSATRNPAPRKNADDAACSTLQRDIRRALEGNSIEFPPNSAEIAAASAPAIATVADLLDGCASATVEIGGHTDNQGRAEASEPLSQGRADAVLAALVDAGIDADRLTAVGYGETQPIASNLTAEGQAANRRIEITVK